MELSPKYCAAQFLEPITNGTELASHEWPLHCTLAGVFSVDWTDERRQAFRELVESIPTFAARTTRDDYFGPDHTIRVMRIERAPELLSFHATLLDFITTHNGDFKQPHYIGEDFNPHITILKDNVVARNQAITYSALTLVAKIPVSAPKKWRVMETIPLR